MCSKLTKKTPQSILNDVVESTCSKSTIKTVGKDAKYVQS